MEKRERSIYNKTMEAFEESSLSEKDQIRVLRNEISSLKIKEGEDRKKIKKIANQILVQFGIIGILLVLLAAYPIIFNGG